MVYKKLVQFSSPIYCLIFAVLVIFSSTLFSFSVSELVCGHNGVMRVKLTLFSSM